LAGFLVRRTHNEQSETTIGNFHVTKIEELCCPRSAAVSVTCPRYLYTYAGRKKWTGVFSILAAGCILVRVFAIEVTEPAGGAHGFPGLCDINGNKLANGEFRQSVEGNQLNVIISYDFDDGQWFLEAYFIRVILSARRGEFRSSWGGALRGAKPNGLSGSSKHQAYPFEKVRDGEGVYQPAGAGLSAAGY
jgi:hypothetical protein